MLPKNWDLRGMVAFTVLTIGLVAWDAPLPAGLAWIGMALALILPGYAVSVALWSQVDVAERMLYSLGLTLGLDILGGLILHVTPWGLNPLSWVAWLGGITLAGCAAAWHRRRTAKVEAELPRLRLDPGLLFGLGIALVIGVLAVFTAQASARQRGLPFTQLWALGANTAGTCHLQVGILNQENKPQSYELIVAIDGYGYELLTHADLASNEPWTALLALPCPTQTVHVDLYRSEDPKEIYRSVELSPTAFLTPSAP